MARHVRKCFERSGYPIEDFGSSRTQQQFMKDCDINVIVDRYRKTGVIPPATQGFYADVSELPSYHDALNMVIAASEAFGSLPSAVRTRFANDPGALLDFVGDPANLEEARRLGLVPKEAPKAAPDASPAGGAGGAPPAQAAAPGGAPEAA